MILKTILMRVATGIGCVLFLSGCAGLENTLTSDVASHEIKADKFDFTKPSKGGVSDKEVVVWRSSLQGAIKEDCVDNKSYFRPAPSPATNQVKVMWGYRLTLSEPEAGTLIGTIDRSSDLGRFYVLFPEYFYCVITAAVPPEATKIPYTCLHNKSAGGLWCLATDQTDLYMYGQDTKAVAYEVADSRAEEALKNIYAANNAAISKHISDMAAEKAAAEEAEAKAKEEAEAKAKEAEQKEIQEFLAWDGASAKATAEAMKGKTIVFKSLYLGMPIGDAYHILCKELDPIYDMENLSQMGATGFLAFPMKDHWMPFTGFANVLMTMACQVPYQPKNTDSQFAVLLAMDGVSAIIEANPKGEVVTIALSARVIDKLFSANGLDGSAFADQFMKSYGISKMETVGTLLNPAWTFTSKDGAKLTIDSEKTLLLEKVSGQQEVKKAFN